MDTPLALNNGLKGLNNGLKGLAPCETTEVHVKWFLKVVVVVANKCLFRYLRIFFPSPILQVQKFLLGLKNSLPSMTVTDHTWPPAPYKFLTNANQELKKIFHHWRVGDSLGFILCFPISECNQKFWPFGEYDYLALSMYCEPRTCPVWPCWIWVILKLQRVFGGSGGGAVCPLPCSFHPNIKLFLIAQLAAN